ncbi:hypothetical protein SAMN05216276_107517 [Streptosporangium subroseum]|uniref:Uncharacterized protein n=1 Tax=Streptosporangium subroseum TaxID=106412 RepID=A0A239NYH0_9ACTN|nr:hypothetical protein SAMN05216276_107517 [Streptosporangium subroseum]
MIWFLLALAAVAVLAPLIGADTRDGRDWQPAVSSGTAAASEEDGLRTTGSLARASAAPEGVAAHRPAPATC